MKLLAVSDQYRLNNYGSKLSKAFWISNPEAMLPEIGQGQGSNQRLSYLPKCCHDTQHYETQLSMEYHYSGRHGAITLAFLNNCCMMTCQSMFQVI
jgi:hypothetical protein